MESFAAEHRWPQLDMSVGTVAYLGKGPPWSASESNGCQNWFSIPNCTSIPLLPLYGSPAAYLGLLGALAGFIIWWLWRNLLELPPLEHGARSTLDRRPLQVSDSHGYFRYPAIHSLEAVPDVRLLDPNSMEETIRALPDAAAAVQMVWEASIHYYPNGRVSDEVAGISSKIVDAFSRILGTTNVIVSREGATIHPANHTLIQGLKHFHDNIDMVQSTVATGNTCADMFHSWECKLEKDAEGISQDEKGEKYIFLLNNTYDLWEKMCFPKAPFSDVELVSRLISMIQRHRKSYFDECWLPLISLLEGDYLKNPRRSSLVEFTRGFVNICRCQMTWKVRPGLKYELREEIKNVMVRPYEAFLDALQTNSSRCSVVYLLKPGMWRKKNKKEFTVEQLKTTIEQLYES